ncbi:hypothetical protein [Idiomarina abyssalis]|uniref:Uncharacterized protein n=1 Tax=Idiomarina abyssalis TaxID=86102 RepID=A0A8I1GDQ4_9GAMM|nr:hypothetical protein [Idiomarina abyssalis]MBJ7265424.1 hypothetical protein [Idiomarina abyssalis]MBJ7316902.1 hypothetical protein [Idiomarina abyssalis]
MFDRVFNAMSIRIIVTSMALALSTGTIAEESKGAPLTSTELAHVVSGIITLKTQCKSSDDDACKQADAVMKMFNNYTLENSSPNGKKKNSMGLLMESLVNSYIDASAEVDKEQRN